MALDLNDDVGYRTAVWTWFLAAGHADGAYGSDPDKTAHIKECGVDPLASGMPDFEEVSVFDSFNPDRTTTAVCASVVCRCGRFGRRSGQSATWTCETPELSEMIKGVATAAARATTS